MINTKVNIFSIGHQVNLSGLNSTTPLDFLFGFNSNICTYLYAKQNKIPYIEPIIHIFG